MLVTEEQAKTKWCPPQVRLIRTPSKIDPNDPPYIEPAQSRCISSACMWWRWQSRSPTGLYPSPDGGPQTAVRRGYCGMAGKPES